MVGSLLMTVMFPVSAVVLLHDCDALGWKEMGRSTVASAVRVNGRLETVGGTKIGLSDVILLTTRLHWL